MGWWSGCTGESTFFYLSFQPWVGFDRKTHPFAEYVPPPLPYPPLMARIEILQYETHFPCKFELWVITLIEAGL